MLVKDTFLEVELDNAQIEPSNLLKSDNFWQFEQKSLQKHDFFVIHDKGK